MASSNFYTPRMASLTKREKVFLGSTNYVGLIYSVPSSMMTRHVVDSFSGPAQISYNFSQGVRRNMFKTRTMSSVMVQYGVSGFSFRLLYEFLCNVFNGGVLFIDTYFESIFGSRKVSERFNQLNDEIASAVAEEYETLMSQAVQRKDGGLDMRYRLSKYISKAALWQQPIRNARAASVAADIKRDIVACLAGGIIPLRKQTVSAATEKIRRRLSGVDPRAFFYASGQLIEHLNIYVAIGKE